MPPTTLTSALIPMLAIQLKVIEVIIRFSFEKAHHHMLMIRIIFAHSSRQAVLPISRHHQIPMVKTGTALRRLFLRNVSKVVALQDNNGRGH
jgi:hypothetical protein